MKKSRIIAPALGVLILSTAASITGTVAWFTANNSVAVTGMVVKTKVGNNLLIANADTATPLESEFGSDDLSQTRTGLLEPVSSVDGENFFYTVKAKADGSKESGDYTAYSEATALTAADTGAKKTNYDADFNTAYSVDTANPANYSAYQTAYGFIDYNFYLRAASTSASQKLSFEYVDLLYNNGPVSETAWRVAIFKSAGQSAPTNLASAPTSLLSILSPRDAINQTAGKAVSGVDEVDTVTYNTACTIDTLNAGVTNYYKLTVRLWLEGEDKTCTSDTFATLTQSWSLNLSIKLSDATGTDHLALAEVDASATGATATAVVLPDVAISGYQWYEVPAEGEPTVINGATDAEYELTTAGTKTVYCVATKQAGGTLVSNRVTVTKA